MGGASRRAPEEAVRAVLKDVASLLRTQDVRGILVGDVAERHLGVARPVREVRLMVPLAEDRWDPFFEAAFERGLVVASWRQLYLVAMMEVAPLRHRETGLPVILHLGDSPIEVEMVSRGLDAWVCGVRLPVMSAEDLLFVLAARREGPDTAAIEALLDAHPWLDVERVRGWMAEELQENEGRAEIFGSLLQRRGYRKE
ncbi:MAG: hypothetical protein ACE5JG_06125 [Planctomycetota bacterium]